MNRFSTGKLRSKLSDCDNIEQFKQEILPCLQDQRTAWAEKIQQILADTGYSCRQMAQLCQVTEPAVRKWKRGSLPQNRDMYIRIGFAAGYGLEEMNAFLKRYGKCPQLYVKSLEDSVCIFVLRSDSIPHTYESYLLLLETVRLELNSGEGQQGKTYSTEELEAYFSNVRSMREMVAFAKKHAPSYRQAYGRLYSYVIAFLDINVTNVYMNEGDGRKASFHSMATESHWSSSLRHCISDIRGKKWFPLRHKIISLGLHLNMDTYGINRMLQYAQMELLCVSDPIEATIIWAIEEAKLATPDDEIVPDGSSDLCEYVKNILLQMDFSESEYLIDDL